MIERFYLKDYLSFKEVELDLKPGVVVFSGPSGSGKSILMSSMLSSFGLDSCDASICESTVLWDIDSDSIEMQSGDITVFKHIKKEKSRYFINNQSVSKKEMSIITLKHLKHLSLRDFSDFENINILNIIDSRVELKDKNIKDIKSRFAEAFFEYKKAKKELMEIEAQQKQIVELKEFATYEIKKIESINPKISEDEELLEIKKELSKKEKVLKTIESADMIFSHENSVFTLLELLGVENSFFSDTMNELRAVLDGAQERFNALDEMDIEGILNRIEDLSELKRRYGSIEDALEYKKQKINELLKYENIEFQKSDLEAKVLILNKEILELSDMLSKFRADEIVFFKNDLNHYVKELYLRDVDVEIIETQLQYFGKDEIIIKLNKTDLNKVSTGEFNRLRLAVLAVKSGLLNQKNSVLILDEIDANLSGEESMSVAKVLKQLSREFQIFVISHQPQLTSMGDQHFLVYKEGENSFVKELEKEERVNEIARIISGDTISKEAKKFAKELLVC